MSTTDRSAISVLIAGAGSIGQRHLRNLRTLGVAKLAVCDLDVQLLQRLASQFDVATYPDYEEALGKVRPDAAVICTPPTLHVPQALQAVRAGAHVFVEKPLSHSLEGVDDLIREAAAAGRVIQVGYNFRFHRGLRRVKAMLDEGVIGRVIWARSEFGQYLPEWRPNHDYRTSYTAHRSLGGGIILDSSHEIDYMRWLFGEIDQVYCLAGTLSGLEVAAEDTACMTVHFVSGVVGQINVDFVQRVKTRNCKIVGTQGTIIWDNWTASVDVFTADNARWERIQIPGDTNDKYLAEMDSFLSCLDGSTDSVVDARSARRTLAVALAAHESSRSGRPASVRSDRVPSSTSTLACLRGNNFYLSPFLERDISQRYLDWLNDPDVNRFLEVRLSPQSFETTQVFVRSFYGEEEKYLWGIYPSGSAQPVGTVSLYHINRHHGSAEIGLMVGDKAFWGRGASIEAIDLIAAFGFQTLGLRRLTGGTYASNLGMNFTFQRLGFSREGILRKAYLSHNGAYVDGYRWSIMADEWMTKRAG